MPIFTIKDAEKTVQISTYHVEAETKEEALDKYINELAGSLEVIDMYYDEDAEEDITID